MVVGSDSRRIVRMVSALPWAKWPWEQCQAVTIDVYGRCRCDLKRGHDGEHRAERGMYDLTWSADSRMVDHG